MPVDVEPWKLERERREKDNAERIKQAISEAQGRGAKTKRRRTRLKAFRTFLLLARTDERQITVALISKKSGISQAAFYQNFRGEHDEEGATEQPGIHFLLEAACQQIASAAIRELERSLRASAKSKKRVRQAQRVTITLNALIRILFRYPNLFHVEGKIPRDVIFALSRALVVAITAGESLSPDDESELAIIAHYHTTALIGILRSGLGAHLERDDFLNRLIRRSASQILPALAMATGKPMPKNLGDLESIEPPVLLDITTHDGYQRILRAQMKILTTAG